jgi:hypothetical protein
MDVYRSFVAVPSRHPEAEDTAGTVMKMNESLAHCLTQAFIGDIVVVESDAKALIELAIEHGEKYAFRVVLPFVNNMTSELDLNISILAHLSEAAEQSVIRKDDVRSSSKDVLSDIIPDFDDHCKRIRSNIRYFDSPKRSRFDHEWYDFKGMNHKDPGLMTAKQITTVAHHYERLELRSEVDEIVKVMIEGVNVVDLAVFERLLLPLLRLFPPQAEAGGILGTVESYRNLFRTVLRAYIQRYVQKEPAAPRAWERQRRGCGCNDCSKVDEFLTNPRQSVGRVLANSRIRLHLEEQLIGTHCRCSTEKTGSPHTLVVEKATGGWERDLVTWKQICGVAIKAMTDIGIERLRALLGEELEPTMELRAIRLPESSAFEDSPAADILANVLQQKSQRKHERQPRLKLGQAHNAQDKAERLSEETKVGISGLPHPEYLLALTR